MKIYWIIIFIFIVVSCNNHKQNNSSQISIIPKPSSIEPAQGNFKFTPSTVLCYNSNQPEAGDIARSLSELLQPATGFSLQVKPINIEDLGDNMVGFYIDTLLGSVSEEGYHLEVTEKMIKIHSKSINGLFYGIQSLMQLLPSVINSNKISNTEWLVPAVKIKDEPRFPYRGMHLDVSRHFFPKEFIKKYIDLIARYKMNVFHWHLTDDNGWRIEIKKYPKLTGISAWRVDRENEKWNDRRPPLPGEKSTYGGFYTQDEIREIVKYAESRFVEIIPEIEMPGHSCEIFAAYPEFTCFKKEYYVQPGGYWPNSDIFCAGKDETFTFIEDILSEIIPLFPSQYIHIGGDEADKTNWKKCAKCQNRIKSENLNDENELQSYFVKRIEKFLNAHDKKLIGWDEILEGGLASSATVMSWRGVEGGISAAKMGHNVIMCPVSHCYFDYYQANPEFEPEAIGGFTTLKKVYLYEPVPEELSADQSKYILGAQGNLWTEYVSTPSHAEYMTVPRMAALAEVVWSSKQSRNWADFQTRLENEKKNLDFIGINYSKGSYHIDFVTTYDSVSKVFTLIPESEILNASIHYTLDGSEPVIGSSIYHSPIEIGKTTTVKAGIFENGRLIERTYDKTIFIHQGIGAKVKYIRLPSNRYFSTGTSALVDGLTGSKRHGDGFWQGIQGYDLEVVLDLGTTKTIDKISCNFIHNQRSWIFLPASIEVQFSDDGTSFIGGKSITPDIDQKSESVTIQSFSFDALNTRTRFIRFVATNPGPLPNWHPGKGEPAWIFTDEIVIE